MIAFGAVLLMAIGCGQHDKIAKLEKQNEELKAEVEKSHATADYDLQAKCSKDAKAWFNENWSRDKDTALLDFTNHYNKSMNKCFILVEYHYTLGDGGASWMNDMKLWDVYENVQYASFGEIHHDYLKPTAPTEDRVITCELSDKKCRTGEEFNGLVRPYLNN
jgi:hypothetical protein